MQLASFTTMLPLGCLLKWKCSWRLTDQGILAYDYFDCMKKPGIIIVDDHKLFRSGLKYILEESGLYQVIAEASNGAEFLDLLNNATPDLVILDINMPVMNGIDAAKKALGLYPGLPILI